MNKKNLIGAILIVITLLGFSALAVVTISLDAPATFPSDI
jgi:hypothetical protein